MIIIILIFLGVALLGLYLASFLLTDKNTPKGIVFIHGPLAVIGLISLIIYAIINATDNYLSWLAISFFVVAALFGLTMIVRDLFGKSIPKLLLFFHASFAIIGIVCLFLTLI